MVSSGRQLTQFAKSALEGFVIVGIVLMHVEVDSRNCHHKLC
jgi:hypothetical protein